MENKLTLSDICCYLPYGLEIKLNIPSGSAVYKVIQMNENSVKAIYKYPINDRIAHLGEFKPLLRPLSSLTKEITVNGETFVPIVELYKIATGCYKDSVVKYFDIISTTSMRHAMKGYRDYYFGIFISDCDVRLGDNIHFKMWSTDLEGNNPKDEIVKCQSLLFDKLSEWHFDYKSTLLSRGLALEIQD